MPIPIRNLYYLFCYAWTHFPEGEPVETGIDDSPDLPNLFARVLLSGATRLIRRGLDRGYQPFVEETRAPRGKILLGASLRAQTLRRGAVICTFDELTADVAHNQILKATARSLASAQGIESNNRRALYLLVSKMAEVADVRLGNDIFRRVQLSRNTRQYVPLLKLCEFVHRSAMPDKGGAGGRFADILKDEATMSTVFESFLRNFYAHEQSEYRVRSEILGWSGSGSASDSVDIATGSDSFDDMGHALKLAIQGGIAVKKTVQPLSPAAPRRFNQDDIFKVR